MHSSRTGVPAPIKKDDPSSPSVSLFKGEEERMLAQAINNLSMKVQKELAATSTQTKGTYVILKLENDSVEYIEKININVLESLLIESRQAVKKSPENECSFVMTSINNTPNYSRIDVNKKSLYPLNELESIVLRVKEILPRTYAEEACVKAQQMIDACQNVFSHSKKAKLLKAFMALPFAHTMSHHAAAASSPQKLNQQFFDELMQYFMFPLERIHNMICSLYKAKIDIYITIFIVAVLEHITQDILHLSANYVR